MKTDSQITRAQIKEKNFTKWSDELHGGDSGGGKNKNKESGFLKLEDYDDGTIIGDDSTKKKSGKEVWD
jgi:hypothetical protein